jgi:hypothetical protein
MFSKKHLLVLASSLSFLPAVANYTINHTINEAMSFPMDHVLARYKEEHKVADDMGKKHETELKRYLVLCSLYPDSQLNMFSNEVDNLWHTFIIFTKDYEAFCNKIANRFIHHVPFTEETRKQNDAEGAYKEFMYKYTVVFNETPSEKVWNVVNADACSGADYKCLACSKCAVQ